MRWSCGVCRLPPNDLAMPHAGDRVRRGTRAAQSRSAVTIEVNFVNQKRWSAPPAVPATRSDLRPCPIEHAFEGMQPIRLPHHDRVIACGDGGVGGRIKHHFAVAFANCRPIWISRMLFVTKSERPETCICSMAIQPGGLRGEIQELHHVRARSRACARRWPVMA